jgi:hypothetical protein
MAEFLAASGSRKISALTSVSGISGSTAMPIVMDGTTVQVSHTNFLNSTLLNQSNTFTNIQLITSSTAVTEIQGGAINVYATDGNEDTFEILVSDGNGIQFRDWNGAAFETFFEVDTLSGPITISRDTTISGNLTASLNFNNLTNLPTLVSGSSQVISLLPNGVVSGSSQISSLLPNGLVSGSSQISYTGITNIPNGIVSSSLQVLNYGIFATTASNTFIGNQTISGSVSLTGSLTSSLQEGYVLVGNSLGITEAIPTSSFDKGSGFPFSGSAEITGSLEVTKTVSTQIMLNPQILTGELIVAVGFNGMLAGPVSNGGDLVIENGSNLVII